MPEFPPNAFKSLFLKGLCYLFSKELSQNSVVYCTNGCNNKSKPGDLQILFTQVSLFSPSFEFSKTQIQTVIIMSLANQQERYHSPNL